MLNGVLTCFIYLFIILLGSSDLLRLIEEIVSLHQPNDMCLTVAMVAARLLELFILNGEEKSGDNLDQLIEILR